MTACDHNTFEHFARSIYIAACVITVCEPQLWYWIVWISSAQLRFLVMYADEKAFVLVAKLRPTSWFSFDCDDCLVSLRPCSAKLHKSMTASWGNLTIMLCLILFAGPCSPFFSSWAAKGLATSRIMDPALATSSLKSSPKTWYVAASSAADWSN